MDDVTKTLIPSYVIQSTMTAHDRDSDERNLMRWMRLEARKINDGIVAERKTLARLLEEEAPSAVTKGGGVYHFRKETISMLGESLPESLHRRLRLPIIFHFSIDVRNSCYMTDEAAVEALRILGEFSPLRSLHEGRLWVSRAIVYSIMGKYPSAVQIAMG